jgi:uncharacterized protein (DUF952 family)
MILHITTRREWVTAVAAGIYRPTSLIEEGFIHCSTPLQLAASATSHFFARQGLVLLCIRSANVQAEIIYEDLYGRGETLPHIYGPLNLDAVISVVDFPPHSDGSFSLPPGLPNE